MCCVCSHSHGRVGTAWQRSSACGVCFECSPFVCVSGSVLSAFQTFWARYSPATTPTCQLTCSSSSSPSLRSSLCLSLLFGPSLQADEWPPGDEVTVAVTARSHCLSRGEFEGGFFFARACSPHRCEYWPFHPIKEWGPTILSFILILIDVMRRKGTQWALFYMIWGHSEKLSKGSQPVCRQTFSAPLHKLFFFHLWIKISFLLKFLFQAPAQRRDSDKNLM